MHPVLELFMYRNQSGVQKHRNIYILIQQTYCAKTYLIYVFYIKNEM